MRGVQVAAAIVEVGKILVMVLTASPPDRACVCLSFQRACPCRLLRPLPQCAYDKSDPPRCRQREEPTATPLNQDDQENHRQKTNPPRPKITTNTTFPPPTTATT
ncbi:hypothetical protein O3P69_000303 [Scylla paramamosain]|uniref:Secreted protein n=1 Tax=Scylla paramamosain TaxID=85552 RepID=A0AAW0UZY0_SCYPA